MASKTPVPDFLVATKAIRSDTARMAAKESVKFFKESFTKFGFTDTSFNPWPKSNKVMGGGRRTLYKRGDLRNSIVAEETTRRIKVISDTKYSQIHNEGGFITVTKAMKAHFWKLLAEVGKVKKRANGTTDWKTIRKSKKTDFLKRMALMPVGSKIKIPKRQFMGNSLALMQHLQQQHINLRNTEMIKAFKNLKF